MGRLLSKTFQQLLDQADVAINGDRPWDFRVNDPRCVRRILFSGSLGLGETYMNSWWACERIDLFIYHILNAGLDNRVAGGVRESLQAWVAKLLNLQTRARSRIVGREHYDLSLELYRRMLDTGLNYSCAYWQDAQTLDQAQTNKLDLICRKLSLQAGDHVVDIGCGWGGFAEYAARNYGAQVTGITISREQADYAARRCSGLPVEIRLQDYRDLSGRFDHAISIGMFEHVGYKNYRKFMQVVRNCLKPDGLFLLHSIGGNDSQVNGDPWLRKYIFPNGMLPSIRQIGESIEGCFVMEDWHNFGGDYDRTLMSWYQNFIHHRAEMSERFGERFCRMWEYYLQLCAGAFRARKMQLWQLVLSPTGVAGGWKISPPDRW